jgi:hypothetical protein
MGEEQEEKKKMKKKSVLLSFVLNEYETLSLTVREEHRPRISENKLIRYFDLGEMKYQRNEENYIMRSFIICII